MLVFQHMSHARERIPDCRTKAERRGDGGRYELRVADGCKVDERSGVGLFGGLALSRRRLDELEQIGVDNVWVGSGHTVR